MDACLVCKNMSWSTIYNETLLQCRDCGFITANIDIDPDELIRHYRQEYFSGQEAGHHLATKTSREINFRRKVRPLINKIGRTNITSVLEVGCSYGFFANILKKELGKNISYIGLDQSQEAIQYGQNCLKVNVIQADYLKFRPKEMPSDIFMWDVIEHLSRPDRFIEKAKHDLQPGGRLIISTPDIGTLLPRLRGKKWRNIHPPTHLHYFSAHTLRQLLVMLGFRIVLQSHPPVWRNIKHSVRLVMTEQVRQSFWGTRLLEMIPKELTIPVNTFDNLVILAEKC